MTILKEIVDLKNLHSAWRALNRREESYGQDGVTIADFEKNLQTELKRIRRQVLGGTYEFEPLRGYPVKKKKKVEASTDIRPIKIYSIRDRVLQQAVLQKIKYPLFKHHPDITNPASYAFISTVDVGKDDVRSVRTAAQKVHEYYNDGYCYIVKADIIKFFDRINKEILFDKLIFPFLDQSVHNLLKDIFDVEVGNLVELQEKGSVYKEAFLPSAMGDHIGIHQGAALSPLFSNLYLKDFDLGITEAGYKLVRYADDFIIMCRSIEDAKDAFQLANNLLEERGLNIHPESETLTKTKKSTLVGSFTKFTFLGLDFSGPNKYPASEAYRRNKEKLKEFQKKNGSDLSPLDQLLSLKTLVSSWGATYWYCDYAGFQEYLDRELLTTFKAILQNSGIYLRTTPSLDSVKSFGIGSFEESYWHTKIKEDPVNGALAYSEYMGLTL